MRVGCACRIDCLYSLHGKRLELDKACSKCGMGSNHVFEQVVDFAVGGYIISLETDRKAGFC